MRLSQEIFNKRLQFPGSIVLLLLLTSGCNLTTSFQADNIESKKPVLVGKVSSQAADQIWVHPSSLERTIGASGHHNILSDYHEVYDVPGNWNEIATNSQVFGMFQEAMMVMKLDDPAGQGALAQSLKTRGLKVNIEAGGLRGLGTEQCGTNSANAEFEAEKSMYTHWKSLAGGSAPLDYITTDNAIMFAFHKGFARQNNMVPCPLPIETVVDLYVDYVYKMQATFPGVSIGFTEGLGAFSLIGLDNVYYKSTDPTNINIDFETLIKLITTKATQRGITINHFIIDFADGVTNDATAYPNSHYIVGGHDYGRILGAQAIAKKYGLKVGIYPNWVFATSNADAKIKSMNFRREYAQMGGRADFYNFEFWQQYPDKLGAEHDEISSTWNTIRDLIRDLKNSGTLSGCQPLTFKGATLSSSTVGPSGVFTLSCDYGQVDSFIFPLAQGGQCAFAGIAGTSAQFRCTAPATPGTYSASCVHGANTSANTCAQTNAVGSVTVASSAPVCQPLVFKGGSVSSATVAPGAVFSLSCDYGQTDSFIYPSAEGAQCSFAGITGTAAKFNCTASRTQGTYPVGCSHGLNVAAKTCAQINSLGSIKVSL